MLALKRHVGESLAGAASCVDPKMMQPRQDDVVEYRDTGAKAVADTAMCMGQITGEKLRDRVYVRKWDLSRRGNDVVLVRCAKQKAWGVAALYT